MKDAYWVATLSDGTTAVEHRGKFKVIRGERKPWVRLIKNLKGRKITSLRLRIGKRTIHAPKEGKWQCKQPEYYSLCYHVEVEDVLSKGKETHFIDLGAHYDNFTVHYIQDITQKNNSWVTVTDKDCYTPLIAREK